MRASVTAVLVLLLLLALPVGRGLSGEGTSPDSSMGLLDGMQFVGSFGPEGGPGDLTDTLYFEDGMFWSKNCIPCGFPPGRYWVRFTQDGVHFRGELESPERGRFVYEGVVSDGHLSARINWRKERWYWTIDRNFWFEGTLADTEAPVSARQAATLASVADPQPPVNCDPGN